ncbi:hypothetical protein [Laspinema palackyanum]|uniref:hypothetical protein n=1 Tax=Laspinema palackyanum TaxID=3231601 RepID=UPI00345DA048|nr:hypothetical protein [Laspinema sp. D2c]
MMKLLEFLPFVVAPLFMASWLEASFPIWKNWPPILWILGVLLLLILLGKVTAGKLNPATLIALGIGFVLAAWRYCAQ